MHAPLFEQLVRHALKSFGYVLSIERSSVRFFNANEDGNKLIRGVSVVSRELELVLEDMAEVE
jgi:hypothetical protein